MRQQDQLRQVQRQLEEQKHQIDQSLENEERKKQREEEHQTSLDMIEDYRRRGFITDLETQLQIEHILAADQDPAQFIQLSNHYFTEEEDASQQDYSDEDLYAQATGPDREHALYQAQTHLAQTEFLSQANREQVLHQFTQMQQLRNGGLEPVSEDEDVQSDDEGMYAGQSQYTTTYEGEEEEESSRIVEFAQY